jgi:CheY-like chemotaxis protein
MDDKCFINEHPSDSHTLDATKSPLDRLFANPFSQTREKPVARPTPTQQTASSAALRRPRILLADDSSDNLFLLCSYLKRLEVEVEEAEDGSAALQKFAEGNYDLVLMDVHMPVMDGLTAIQRMRDSEASRRSRRTPIVALTASVFGEEVDTCLAAGADMYVAKPIKRGALLDVVTKLLARAAVV